jgi:DNA repair exonuclease SbcCD ATPase subunit
LILHSLSVANWRSLLTSVELGPFSERLNVIHAPNGTGKSSLFEAIRRAMFDTHLVSGEEIEAVRPWGRSLSPKVQVDFTQSGVRYRIEKTFLDGASAHLFRFENGKFQPLADSRDADAKLREIIAASGAPGRGLSKHEHWGLAEVLWAPQGALHLDSLSSSVTENLRAALGVQLTGESGSRLEELLEERYQSYFTKGGKPRTGKQAAPILGLESEQANTAAERQQRLEHQQRFEETSRAVEDARQKRGQARFEADGLRESVAQTGQQAETYLRLQSELEQKRLLEQAAKERFDAIGKSLELIGNAREEIGQVKTKIRSGETLVGELAAELHNMADAVDAARGKRDEIRRQRSTLDERAAEVEDARGFVEDSKAHQTLAARVEKLKQFEGDLKKRKQQRATLVAPDDKIIRDVRKCLAARETAKAALGASLIHLTVQPKKKTTIHRKSPDESKTVTPGAKATFSGSPEVRIEIEGFGTIHASGPEGDAETHQDALQEAEKKLTKLAQPYGTQDPDRLQVLREQANELDQKIEQLESKITELLDDESADELNLQLAELDARIKERLGRFSAWKNQPPTVSDLKSALDKQRKTIEAAIETAEDAFDKVQSAFQAVQKRHSEVDGELKNARLNLEAAQGRLKDLTKDGQSDEARAKAREEALMAWEASKVKAKDCETKLNEIPGDPQKTLQKLERQLAALEDIEAKARDEENQAEGRLQTLAAEGAYSKLVACEEKLTDLKVRIRREKLRMDATRLLYDTVAACKAAAVAAVAAPVERTATQMLDRIAGPRLGTVRLTENFVPAGVRPEIAAEPVELTNLSGGEQEQLFLIIRLALGQVLAKEERQLVVLDDVLNATDTGRLARVLTLLEECADRLQIVILTCHPERYRGLEEAKFFNMKALCN